LSNRDEWQDRANIGHSARHACGSFHMHKSPEIGALDAHISAPNASGSGLICAT
jgi:hypothetical protein